MSEIFSYTRCPKLSKSSYLFGGCFADETWGFTSLTSPVCACSLRVMEKSNWAMDTEAATSENWGKRLFGGTYSHWESWENWKKVKEFEITFTQKKGGMIHFGGMGSGNLWWTIYPTSKWIMKKWNYHDHSWSNYQPSTRRKTETHHAYFFQFGDRIWRSSLETPWAWSLPKFPKQPTTIQPQPLKPQAITKATQKAGQGAPSWMLQ